MLMILSHKLGLRFHMKFVIVNLRIFVKINNSIILMTKLRQFII